MAGILLVEDDADTLRLLEYVLSTMMGHRVIRCTNGQKGMQTARREEENIELIVSDVRMPDTKIDGVEMIRRLRVDEGMTTPVIFVTGRSLEEIKEIHPGFTETGYGCKLLRKPLDPTVLQIIVKEFLGS